MDKVRNPVSILIAEDDDEFYLLMEEAMKELAIPAPLKRFINGEELVTYLSQGGAKGSAPGPRHCLILMDLNMPKKTGHEALREIRAMPELRKIPIVIMTISTDPRDITRCYDAGANSFITKPFDFDQLLKTFEVFQQYWLENVQLPLS